MAHFKQTQYEILTAVINRVAHEIVQAEINDPAAFHPKDRTWQMGRQIMESFVDELCIEFGRDNDRFNETLFRAQCGGAISNEHVIIINGDAKSC